jgi:choloylglycine hydrolase
MRVLATGALCCLTLVCLLGDPTHACTSFCLDTPDGPVYGTNLDLTIPGDGLVFVNQRGIAKAGWQESTTGEIAEWTSEYGSVTFNLAGREFAWGGMNEAGLVVSSMQLVASVLPERDERPPIAISVWAQYVLDTCGTVHEAIGVDSLVRVQDVPAPSHYMVADAEGNCAIIEYIDGKTVTYTGESLPVKALANCPYAPALAYIEEGVLPDDNPGESAERVAAAGERIENFDATRDTNAVDYAFETLTGDVVAPLTKWNVVFDIPRREVWFRSAASPMMKHLSLHSFDFSCEAPLLMLDVNVVRKGDVEEHFGPYDRDVNQTFFDTFCDRWGIEISEGAGAALTDHFDTFECAP